MPKACKGNVRKRKWAGTQTTIGWLGMREQWAFTAAFHSRDKSIWRNVWLPPSGGMTPVGLVHP